MPVYTPGIEPKGRESINQILHFGKKPVERRFHFILIREMEYNFLRFIALWRWR